MDEDLRKKAELIAIITKKLHALEYRRYAEIAGEIYELIQSVRKEEREEFKNFHRNLCKRFGYWHDDVHWKRDLASLEEHIAKAIRDSLGGKS